MNHRQVVDRLLLWGFLAIQAILVIVGVIVAIIVLVACYCGWATWKDLQASFFAALQTVGVATAATGGLMTLVALVAPRTLSVIGLGPDLLMDFDATDENSGCVHEWGLDLRVGDKNPSYKAVIIRLPVTNHGSSAAESVEVVIERIRPADAPSAKVPHFKPSRLRWADSYDVDKFKLLENHRCVTMVEPLIHSDSTHFVDFGFIFDPTSEGYYKQVARPDNSRTMAGYWCLHPVYQWLPYHGESGVLEPGENCKKSFLVDLAIFCKNAHAVRQTLRADFAPQSAIGPNQLSRGSVGALDSSSPIKIGFTDKMGNA